MFDNLQGADETRTGNLEAGQLFALCQELLRPVYRRDRTQNFDDSCLFRTVPLGKKYHRGRNTDTVEYGEILEVEDFDHAQFR